jgi:hypothetical protein
MCVGYRFALQETRLTLAQLYRSYTFELEPGQVPLRVKTGITMSPEEGVFVRVRPIGERGAGAADAGVDTAPAADQGRPAEVAI